MQRIKGRVMKKLIGKYGVAAGGYFLASLFSMVLNNPHGATNSWVLQSLLGPLWHLGAFIQICKVPFGYIDGVVRFDQEVVTMLVQTSLIWIFGLLLVCLAKTPPEKFPRATFRIVLGVYWFIVAFINMYFWSIFSI